MISTASKKQVSATNPWPMSFKSKAWVYFDKVDGQKAKCSICLACIGIRDGSTKGLFTHLRTKHDIDPNKKNEKEAGTSGNATETWTAPATDRQQQQEQQPTKRRRMADYFPSKTVSSEVVLSRMTAKDGIPFQLFISSKDLKAALCSYGIDVPASANTIKSRVLQFAASIQKKIQRRVATTPR